MLLWSQLFQGWLVSYRPLANFVSHFLALAWAWLAHPGRGKRVKRSSCQHLRVISTIPDARDTWFLKSKVTVAMLAAIEPKAPEASAKFAAPVTRPAPPAKPIATPEEAAAWAARIPKQVRPPPPGQLSSQEGVDKTENVAESNKTI